MHTNSEPPNFHSVYPVVKETFTSEEIPKDIADFFSKQEMSLYVAFGSTYIPPDSVMDAITEFAEKNPAYQVLIASKYAVFTDVS